MLSPLSRVKVYVYQQPCDMRKGIDGLSGIVRDSMALNPLSGHCFFFLNRRRNQIKLLYWGRTGYCIWMKRLTKGTFPLLMRGELVASELFALLQGARLEDLERVERQRFSYVS